MFKVRKPGSTYMVAVGELQKIMIKHENIVHFTQPVPIMILKTVLYLKKQRRQQSLQRRKNQQQERQQV